jgi:hypothetical protein
MLIRVYMSCLNEFNQMSDKYLKIRKSWKAVL